MIMRWLIGAYVLGFVGIFLLNASIGPVTLGLALARAAVWPIWVATGWPQGQRMLPGDEYE